LIWNKEEVNEMQTQKIRKNHMDILWHEYTDKGGEEIPVTQASLTEKASIVGRVGIMLLSCGTGAWRVRSSMNALAEEMGITCTADIGLMSIEYTCFDGDDGFTQSLCLTNTGVNTSKLNRLEHFIREFEQGGQDMSGEQLHKLLDQIEEIHGLYSPIALGMAAALACGGFTFLLGGGLIEMFCAFVGAGIGNFIRCKLSKHHFTLFLCIASSVSAACLVYAGLLKAAELLWAISIQHEAGYICAMLFIIPGFPFITSGIDLAKLDMRSGMERLMYALIIVLVATMSAWIMALVLNLQPVDFLKLDLTQEEWIIFRLLTSFCGVFGFSIMFNSPTRLAAVAAGIVFIGDSRMVTLKDAVERNLGSCAAAVVAKNGSRHEWLHDTGIPQADKIIGKGSRVVINMGVNDLSDADKYAKDVNYWAAVWSARGAQIYYASVNPVWANSYGMTEERVKLFNDRLKGQLIPQIIWLDSHDYLMGVGVHASDGVHYKDDTNLVLYQYYLSMIGAV